MYVAIKSRGSRSLRNRKGRGFVFLFSRSSGTDPTLGEKGNGRAESLEPSGQSGERTEDKE
ncbi:hypothetical protein BDW69DRAFT_178790 [Aspergillus filifer]